ncbi:MAG: sterol carrier protein domain-containing protein [Gordonia sp. (in: high G+C Gram-positive bacteria)]
MTIDEHTRTAPEPTTVRIDAVAGPEQARAVFGTFSRSMLGLDLRHADPAADIEADRYLAASEDGRVVGGEDRFLPANSGRYVLGAPRRTPSGEPPSVRVDVADLASTYLGGTAWWQLAAAGRLIVRREGAVERLDTLFATDRLPFAGTVF